MRPPTTMTPGDPAGTAQLSRGDHPSYREPVSFTADSHHVTEIIPARNVEPRRGDAVPTILLMHYTGFASGPQAIDWLACTESGVSCHYVIDVDGRTTQMVRERDRAWHAGESCWHGETDINSCSIGIEIQNPGHDRGYPDFPPAQMEAVARLSSDIIGRHTIPPDRVLAHSDIAPHRKIDPGEKFNWRWLAERGIGLWVEPEPIVERHADDQHRLSADSLTEVQAGLAAYGYDCSVTGVMCDRTRIVVAAFQRHFRPDRVDGIVDRSTRVTLERLLDALR
ncbi:MAG: N-acetylmuramoyl-L-alanine amidase [Pseudomonadota bacterium]